MPTAPLFEKYYFSRSWYVSATVRFHRLIAASCPEKASILEIGAGPRNSTSDYLARLGNVAGLDVSEEVFANPALVEAKVFKGTTFPFADDSFDVCVSNYVLEHVADAETHFREVARVLRPGGFYFFRTPNIWHYVTIGSRLLPHSLHVAIANQMRGLKDAHDPYRTYYRANSRHVLNRLSRCAGLIPSRLELIEPEPSYGKASPLLFFPMMAYERFVNSSRLLELFRINIFGVLQKPA